MNNIDNVLEHHGILGMKWGVQNGPPYPLDSSISTGKKLKNTKNPSKMYKHRKEYTVEELEKENRRFRAEEELFNHNDQYKRRGQRTINRIVNAGTAAFSLAALIKKVGDVKIPRKWLEAILEESEKS